MSGASSSAAKWSTLLEAVDPAGRSESERSDSVWLGSPNLRAAESGDEASDDPRLADIIEPWIGDPAVLTPGRAVLIGFPQDEGVRRNHGRIGAAKAPSE